MLGLDLISGQLDEITAWENREEEGSFGESPYRLISLWELLMKEFPADYFYKFSRRLENFIDKSKTELPEEQWDKIDVLSFLAFFRVTMLQHQMSMPVSLVLVKEMQHLVQEDIVSSYRELESDLRELQRIIERELSSRLFLYVSQDRAGYYKKPTKGWEKIIERWGDTVGDIEEASKCLALNRYAASVFHSLQVVEIGLLELGKFIRVEDPHSGFTAVAGKLKKIIEKKHQDRDEFEKKHFAFLEQIQATVEALKNAWRNKISHAQGRLTLLSTTFNEEIAEEILIASRSFMRRLADEMPVSSD